LDDTKALIEKLLKHNVPSKLVIEENNSHNYMLIKETSRDGAYENSVNQMGKFLYGEENKTV
jgi:hypothetical protein